MYNMGLPYVTKIHLHKVERQKVEWQKVEWPKAERQKVEWPKAERQKAELDPMPNRDPRPNDRRPNDRRPKGTERRIGLNTEFERRKTEGRKLFSQFHMLHINSTIYLWRILKFSRHPQSWVVVRPNLGDDDWTLESEL